MIFKLIPNWFISVLFRSFEAKEVFIEQVRQLRKRYPHQPIAFAVHNGGIVEFLALQIFLNDSFGEDLKLSVGTRIPAFLIESPRLLLRRVASFFRLGPRAPSRIRMCSQALSRGEVIMLNFEINEKRKSFQTPIGEIELSYLAEQNPELLLVPTTFVWRRKRRLEAGESQKLRKKIWRNVVSPISSPWNLILGDPYQPTGIRKILIMLRQYSSSTLRISSPIGVTEHPAKPLRRRVIISIQQEKRVILGPMYRSTRLIGESILRSPNFNHFVRRIAAEEGTSELSVFKRAQKNFNEIAARFSYFTVETLVYFFSFVFKTIFTEVTVREKDFDKLRVASREGSLLFIPTHKSYVDFLILSFLLFRKDLLPPHIAAGINLSFWPVGSILKRGGAFFIKRSFRGDLVYQEVLRRYVAELLQNKINLEFFIEGQRSRSGKLAPPKFGMLKMIIDSYFDGQITEKVFIVPTSICYDRVTEERAHKRELEGGEKVQESAFGLLKSVKVLFKNFGRVHLRMADPISVPDLINQFVEAGQNNPATRKLGVSKIAFEICHKINEVTPITSFGVVCALLLSRPGGAMGRAQLESLIEKMKSDVRELKIILAPDLEEDFVQSCQRAVDRLLEDGMLIAYSTASGAPGIKIVDKQRIGALYYKNTLIHAFLAPAIKGLSRGHPERILELRSLLQFEFFFAEKETFVSKINSAPTGVMYNLYAYMLDDTLETITLGLRGLMNNQGLFLDAKEWKSRLMKFGQACIVESTVARSESVNTTGFAAFVEMAQNRGWLKTPPTHGNLITPAPTSELAEVLDSIKALRTNPDEWEMICDFYISTKPQEAPFAAKEP